MRGIWGVMPLVFVSVLVSTAAKAELYNVGCTNAVCVIVDATGKITNFDSSQKKINGSDQLPGKVTAPVVISCNAVSGNEGCVAVDGAGQIWIGPARPQVDIHYQLITTIPK